jgi:Nif-specific regulatory protein
MPALVLGREAILECISQDPRMKPVVRLVLRAAACGANVLLVGESGVGKAFIARKIHEASPMASRAFRTVFCLPDADGVQGGEELVRQLYLMERSCGTVYVRDIDRLSPAGQAKLSGYLDERSRRIRVCEGGDSIARQVFSSRGDLRTAAFDLTYSRELYIRVAAISIHVPPLRKRGADVVSLANHFVRLCSRQQAKALGGLTMEAEELLRNQSWQGNIQELKNIMTRAVVLAEDGEPLGAGVLQGVINRAGS